MDELSKLLCLYFGWARVRRRVRVITIYPKPNEQWHIKWTPEEAK